MKVFVCRLINASEEADHFPTVVDRHTLPTCLHAATAQMGDKSLYDRQVNSHVFLERYLFDHQWTSQCSERGFPESPVGFERRTSTESSVGLASSSVMSSSANSSCATCTLPQYKSTAELVYHLCANAKRKFECVVGRAVRGGDACRPPLLLHYYASNV